MKKVEKFLNEDLDLTIKVQFMEDKNNKDKMVVLSCVVDNGNYEAMDYAFSLDTTLSEIIEHFTRV